MLFALIRIMKLERINTENIAQLLLFHFYIYQLLPGARGVEQGDKFMRKVLEKLWMRIKLNETFWEKKSCVDSPLALKVNPLASVYL